MFSNRPSLAIWHQIKQVQYHYCTASCSVSLVDTPCNSTSWVILRTISCLSTRPPLHISTTPHLSEPRSHNHKTPTKYEQTWAPLTQPPHLVLLAPSGPHSHITHQRPQIILSTFLAPSLLYGLDVTVAGGWIFLIIDLFEQSVRCVC